jgi:hypothetical protein
MPANLPAARRGKYSVADGRKTKKQRELSHSAHPFFERTNGNPRLKRFDHYTLIFGGTPKNSVFLGYFFLSRIETGMRFRISMD